MVKIAELTKDEHDHIIKNDWMPDTLIKWLNDKELQELGAGAYSSVYGHWNTDKIVKINRRMDDAYKDFVMFAKANPSEYFPKIYDVKEMQNGGLFLFITEKLDKYDPSIINSNMDKYLDFISYLNTIESMTNSMLRIGPNYNKRIIDRAREAIRKGIYPDGTTMVDAYDDQVKKSAEAFKSTRDGELLQEVFSMGEYDLHKGNVMIRPRTNHIVLTDPIFPRSNDAYR